jgi:glucose/arabinose dehydrogenase
MSATASRLLAVLAVLPLGARADLPVQDIRLPPGFEISVYASGMPEARALALGDGGTLFLGSKTDKVYAVSPATGAASPAVRVIAQGLQAPHGVAFRDGALYVAERTRILRFDDIERRLADPPLPAVVYDGLPKYAHHGLRTIHFGPDGMLYVPVGAPCNICLPEPEYAVITRIDLAANPPKREVFARGVRNTVGYDWHPETNELWFTDNGRDLLGNDAPPDELNHAPRPLLDFGYPHCHGGDLPDPEFGLRRPCSEFTAPAQKLMPHAAALGMRFYTGNQFPAEYRNRIFIAEHGSWNRKPPTGYRITMVTLRDNQPVRYEVFADGWLQGTSAWGRPVDVVVARDGALLVSDDKAGVVYRIAFKVKGEPR